MTKSRFSWLDTRACFWLLVLLSGLPLFWPQVPPLTDLPGHMGRYAVQLGLDTYPHLKQWYDFKWGLVPNLGVDLIVQLVGPVLGVELTVKLVMIAVQMLVAASLLLIAKRLHGYIPATALLALPFAYSLPFNFGFANYALAVALALFAFWGWLSMRGPGRAILFAVIAPSIWVAHLYGWAILCILCFAAECVAARDQGKGVVGTLWTAGLACLPLATPLLIMAATVSAGPTPPSGDWFNIRDKLHSLTSPLEDRWQMLDILSAIVALVMIFHGARSPSAAMNRTLAFAAILMATAFLLLPRVVIGSAYADMRLVPVMLMMALLAIHPVAAATPPYRRAIAMIAIAFFAGRTIATTTSYALFDRDHRSVLQALDHVPHKARLLSLVGKGCRDNLTAHRMDHLPGLAIVRRQAYSNEQWTLSGGQLLTAHYAAAGAFRTDPSQFLVPDGCRHPEAREISKALAEFPRDGFDYVWIMAAPSDAANRVSDLQRVWHNKDAALYRVIRPASPAHP